MEAELLILVTQSFPFGSYVDFLEDEIDYLAARFREVRIAPYAPEGSEQRVPPNVKIELGLASRVSTRAQRISAGLLSGLGRRLILDEIRHNRQPRRHPESLARLLAATGLAAETARWVRSLGPLPMSSLGMTVWLGGPTVGLASAGLPTVSRIHGGDLYPQRAPNNFLPLQEVALAGCVKVYPVSDAGRIDLANRFPHLAPQITTVHLGVAGVPGVAAASADGVLRVMSCSSLIPVKRPLLLVDVIRELAAIEREVEWNHFGAGPLFDEVTQRAAALPVSCTHTLHGHVPNSTVLAHYGNHPVDVFLNVSSSEGIPVTMMEAMSSGVPVVATDVGGVREIVSEETGRLVPFDADAAQIARAVQSRAALSRSVSTRLATRSLWEESFSSRYNFERFANELAEIATVGPPLRGP